MNTYKLDMQSSLNAFSILLCLDDGEEIDALPEDASMDDETDSQSMGGRSDFILAPSTERGTEKPPILPIV